MAKSGLRVSTDEWLDLQKVLEKGKIEDLDQMYVVSKAVLVKDVTDYPKFDTVFGKLFFGIEPPSENEDDFDDQQEEPEPEELEENKSQEIVEPGETEEHHGGDDDHKEIKDSKSSGNEEKKEDQKSEKGQNPKEDGKENGQKSGGEKQTQSGDSNGGEKGQETGSGQKAGGQGSGESSEKTGKGEISMGMKDGQDGGSKEEQKSGGDKNMQAEGGGDKNKNKDGGSGQEGKESDNGKRTKKEELKETLSKGKGGLSAKEIISQRKHEVFDKDKILNYEQFGRVLAKLITIIQDNTQTPTDKLDIEGTVDRIAGNAGAPELIFSEEVEEKPKVILMFDSGGSTDEFKPIMEKLFAAAVDYLESVDVYYFHNAVYGHVWLPKDDSESGALEQIPLEKVLSSDPKSKVIIVGDAWMADEDWMYGGLYDSWNSQTQQNLGGLYDKSGYENFKAIRDRFNNVVWINPIMERDRDEMDNSGTISDIEKVFPSYELTLHGIEKATQHLMEV